MVCAGDLSGVEGRAGHGSARVCGKGRIRLRSRYSGDREWAVMCSGWKARATESHRGERATPVRPVRFFSRLRVRRTGRRAVMRAGGRECETPHPLPLSPVRGEGCYCAFSRQKTHNPPVAPVKRGRGVGGEGARHTTKHTASPRTVPPTPPDSYSYSVRPGGRYSYSYSKTDRTLNAEISRPALAA